MDDNCLGGARFFPGKKKDKVKYLNRQRILRSKRISLRLA